MAQSTSTKKKQSNKDAQTQSPRQEELSACEAATDYFKQYARERPEIVAAWAFGIGFVLGWKLKPW